MSQKPSPARLPVMGVIGGEGGEGRGGGGAGGGVKAGSEAVGVAALPVVDDGVETGVREPRLFGPGQRCRRDALDHCPDHWASHVTARQQSAP